MAGTSSKIPIEITSDKETVSIEAALAFAASSPVTPAAVPAIHSPISDSRKAKSIQSISDKAKRSLFVTDVTKTEWCDKQMEFSLFAEEWCSQTQTDMALVYGGGGRRNNDAMQADIDRHINR
ncbi:hypothetical protein SESBI_27756 [Sesbania bispinosa]|nr:hypothetical protein SESBI_27756 [Sesbania bispinosa]